MTDASPGDIVLVTWLDACVGVGHYWRTPEDAKAHELAKVHSVGFLVARTDAITTLMQSSGPDECGGLLAIPTRGIRRFEVLVRGEAPEG